MPRAPLPKAALQQTLQQAVALHRQGLLNEAERLYTGILAGAPRHFDALHLLGVLMHQRGRSAEALALIDRALAANARSADALLNRANVLFAMRRFNEALSGYRQAMALRPGDPELMSNCANTLSELGRPRDAVPLFERAMALRPSDPDILNNCGNALLQLNRAAEALERYGQALQVRPNDVQSLINRGNALSDLRRPDEALASYDRAVALAPDHAEAHWNRSLVRLSRGDFAGGFAEYEWRLRRTADRRNFLQPQWRGEDVAGRRILLHAEQGFGDTIQFVRYAPLLAARGAVVAVEVQPSLKPMLRGLPGVVDVIGRGEPLPAFDRHCPLMSLPLAFGTTLATIPADTPYLHATADRIEFWRTRLPGGHPRVGLAWSGSPTHRNDHNRSVALSRLAPLLQDDRLSFVSLQRELRDGDAELLQQFSVYEAGPQFQDFADTAAAIALLDLVISVDTAVAHLAGALGKPVWLLLPFSAEWRWLEDREDSPWYPTARLFRQHQLDDWGSVVARVGQELGRMPLLSGVAPL